MKKIIFYLFTICIIGLVIFLTVSSLNRNDPIEIYTIKEARSFLYSQSEEQVIDLYSNKEELLIEYPNENTYKLQLNDKIEISLANVSVEKVKLNNKYLYTIKYLLPALNYNEIFNEVYLKIKNSKYKVNILIGEMKMINEKYKLLSFNNLYGSYSYVNNELRLVGINIEIANDFTAINSCNITDEAIARFDICKNELQKPEIDIFSVLSSYSINRVVNVNYLSKNKTIFIPLGYKNDYFIRKGVIEFIVDQEKYIIDTPSFIANKLDIDSFTNLKIKGEVIYD